MPVLQTQETSPARGAIVCGKGDHWGTIPAGADTYVLTCSANAADGTGLAWVAPYALPSALTGATAVLSGSIAVNGVATPPAKAASPGTASGTDAAVINAIALVLKNLGFTS